VAPSQGKAELGSVGQGSVGEQSKGLRGVRGFIEPYFGSH
jgi:stage V sporulation protein SpoVS